MKNPSTKTRVWLGSAVWIGVVVLTVPHVLHLAWAYAMLLFAALVLVPLALDLVDADDDTLLAAEFFRMAHGLQLPAALLLILAFVQPAGMKALACAAPWIICTGLVATTGLLRILRRGITPLSLLCRDVGLVFLAVGGGWLTCDRIGFRPLGFSPDIVLLTAIHFHFAGLILPIITGRVVAEFSDVRFAALVGYGVLSGVPLVAVGITASQLGTGHGIELFSTAWLAMATMAVASMHLILAAQRRWPMWVRAFWAIAACALFFSMSLAVLYATRPYVMPIVWLDIPWMRALHGTANVFGFALPAVIAWRRTAYAQALIREHKDSRK